MAAGLEYIALGAVALIAGAAATGIVAGSIAVLVCYVWEAVNWVIGWYKRKVR